MRPAAIAVFVFAEMPAFLVTSIDALCRLRQDAKSLGIKRDASAMCFRAVHKVGPFHRFDNGQGCVEFRLRKVRH